MSLSSTRARRENAGSRMRALVEQQMQENASFGDDVLDDAEDYVADAQDDVFDDDFGSTDEDEEQLDDEAAVRAEEKAARQQVQKKLKTSLLHRPKARATAASALAATDRPVIPAKRLPVADKPSLSAARQKRKAALGDPMLHSVRQSNRSSTMAATQQLQQKLVETTKRRALVPQRPRVAEIELTQEQKLEEAKETEKLNLASLEKMIQCEEEGKAKRATQKARVEGPLLRFRSFKYPLIQDLDVQDLDVMDADVRSSATHAHSSNLDSTMERSPSPPKAPRSAEDGAYSFESRSTLTFENFVEDPFATYKTRQRRPQSHICPITGLRARYRDPVLSVPYATKEAYATLKRLVQGAYAWSPVCQAYIHPFDAHVPSGTPDKWLDSSFGEPLLFQTEEAAVMDPSAANGKINRGKGKTHAIDIGHQRMSADAGAASADPMTQLIP
ncbi:Vacuolar protein sorting-associated protein 72 [Geranomyces michiganensis]|nr:Vacuolar protein sorting-associated protein 72 [Geranomyces michiganensis]